MPMAFKVVTAQGVLKQGQLVLPPHQVLDAGCRLIVGPGPWGLKGFVKLEALIPAEPRSEGFYVVETDSGFLSAMTDIWKYQTQFSVTMDADPYRPLSKRD